jgi:hypothetical protein
MQIAENHSDDPVESGIALLPGLLLIGAVTVAMIMLALDFSVPRDLDLWDYRDLMEG